MSEEKRRRQQPAKLRGDDAGPASPSPSKPSSRRSSQATVQACGPPWSERELTLFFYNFRTGSEENEWDVLRKLFPGRTAEMLKTLYTTFQDLLNTDGCTAPQFHKAHAAFVASSSAEASQASSSSSAAAQPHTPAGGGGMGSIPLPPYEGLPMYPGGLYPPAMMAAMNMNMQMQMQMPIAAQFLAQQQQQQQQQQQPRTPGAQQKQAHMDSQRSPDEDLSAQDAASSLASLSSYGKSLQSAAAFRPSPLTAAVNHITGQFSGSQAPSSASAASAASQAPASSAKKAGKKRELFPDQRTASPVKTKKPRNTAPNGQPGDGATASDLTPTMAAIKRQLCNFFDTEDALKWGLFEFFYSTTDRVLLKDNDEFARALQAAFPKISLIESLTRPEWFFIKSLIARKMREDTAAAAAAAQRGALRKPVPTTAAAHAHTLEQHDSAAAPGATNGKARLAPNTRPRRFSGAFIRGERQRLEKQRESIALLQEGEGKMVKGVDLPELLPQPLCVGDRVLARPNNKPLVFPGYILATKTAENRFRVEFDRNVDLGTVDCRDMDIAPFGEAKLVPVASLAKARPTTMPSRALTELYRMYRMSPSSYQTTGGPALLSSSASTSLTSAMLDARGGAGNVVAAELFKSIATDVHDDSVSLRSKMDSFLHHAERIASQSVELGSTASASQSTSSSLSATPTPGRLNTPVHWHTQDLNLMVLVTKVLRMKEVLLREQAKMNSAARQDVAEGTNLGVAFTQRYSWICDRIASLNSTLDILLARMDSRRSPVEMDFPHAHPHSHSLPRNRETQDIIMEGREKAQSLVASMVAPNANSDKNYSERMVQLVSSCMSLLYMIRACHEYGLDPTEVKEVLDKGLLALREGRIDVDQIITNIQLVLGTFRGAVPRPPSQPPSEAASDLGLKKETI